jgi:hypothetical protein
MHAENIIPVSQVGVIELLKTTVRKNLIQAGTLSIISRSGTPQKKREERWKIVLAISHLKRKVLK